METKIVYQVDELGIYVGQAVADASPLEEGVWLIPSGCVKVAPPKVPAGKAARWDGGRWKLVDSYQGLTAYNTRTLEPIAISRSGPLPDGYTLDAPRPGQIWENGQWVDDLETALANLYANQLSAVNLACQLQITGGIWSSALGSPHLYGTQMEDQLNLTGLLLLGFGGAYPCTDEAGTKAFVDHSQQQLLQVGDEFTTFKMQLLTKANSLKSALAKALAANDINAVAAITWEGTPA